jgi:hypothetical protein
MRYRLRTLLIVLFVGPVAIAQIWFIGPAAILAPLMLLVLVLWSEM